MKTSYDDDRVGDYDMIAAALGPGEPLCQLIEEHTTVTGGPVLDVGAGTGTSSLPFLRNGWPVTALDQSESMLAILKSRTEGYPLNVIVDDFFEFKSPTKFPLQILSRNTFLMAGSWRDKVRLLQNLGAHLSPGGEIWIDVTDPSVFMGIGGDFRSYTLPLGREQCVTITQTTNRSSQRVMSIYCVQGEGPPRLFHEEAVWTSEQEVEMLASMAGLRIDSVFGDYSGTEYEDSSSAMIIRVVREAQE